MPDNTKKPEQSIDQDRDKISDLPDRPITDQDAQTVKGGAAPVKGGLTSKI